MSVYLHALALQYYRGIGPSIQKLSPFRGFNFFIGPNNAGKSTILDFLSKYLHSQENKPPQIPPVEQYRGEKTGVPVAAVGIPLELFIKNIYEHVGDKANHQIIKSYVPLACKVLAEDDVVWISIPFGQHRTWTYLSERPPASAFRTVLRDQDLLTLWSFVTGSRGGGIDEHWIPDLLKTFREAQNSTLFFPSVKLVPALRQIGPKAQEFSDFSGRGLIDRLAEIQSPDHDKRGDRQIFDRINQFVQAVTGRSSAQIEVPHHREHILVHMDNKVLPLLSLGTGIHEVVMIAAFCTLSEGQIVCIEEPEIHLHPLLQRKLISYLRKNTDNWPAPGLVDTLLS